VPLEEERAMHLQEEAERALQRTLEAEAEAEKARRAAAEEAFRFEAAKAEVCVSVKRDLFICRKCQERPVCMAKEACCI